MGIRNLNCILVLEESVRSQLKSNISHLSIYGIEIVEDIRKITKPMVTKTRKVIILGSYRYDALDDLKLFKEVLGLEYYFISNDEKLLSLMKSLCKCFYLEHLEISNKMLDAILMGDKAEQEKYKVDEFLADERRKNNSLTLANRILEGTTDSVMSTLCKDYIRCSSLLDMCLDNEKDYTERISTLESMVLSSSRELNSVYDSYKSLVQEVMEQEKFLKDYKVYFTQDLYKRISLSKYKNRPRILYLKEYQDLLHEDSFLITLFNSLKIQGNLSCKIVRLHDSNDLHRIKMLQDRYTVIDSSFKESDLIISDFILSYGSYEKMFDLLLSNKYSLDVLIVLDCKKHDSVILDGVDVVYLNICRNKEMATKLGLKEINTVVNNSDSALSWDTYRIYKKLKTNEERFEYLSSRPIIRRIYSLVKEV